MGSGTVSARDCRTIRNGQSISGFLRRNCTDRFFESFGKRPPPAGLRSVETDAVDQNELGDTVSLDGTFKRSGMFGVGTAYFLSVGGGVGTFGNCRKDRQRLEGGVPVVEQYFPVLDAADFSSSRRTPSGTPASDGTFSDGRVETFAAVRGGGLRR